LWRLFSGENMLISAREYGPNEKPHPAFQPSVSCNPKKIRPDRKNILLDYFVAALVMSDNKSG
jgi:hypothetical protein